MLSDVIGPPSNPPMEAEQGTSSRAEQSSILEPDPEDTLVGPFEDQIESFFPEVYRELAAEFLPVPDDEESPDGNTTPYFVQDTETYVIGSDDEDMDDCGEEDPTVIMSNRQSTFSSFTGASLLASPRNSVFGKSSVASPIEDGAMDLLSPVQLSAKLQPFPIPSSDSKIKRGDSIDSGYADGDSWVSPLPFPCSPPSGFRPPVTFLSLSRRASHSSPALLDRRVSYDVSVLRRSPHNPIEVIREVGPDESLEDNEDIAYTILGAYGTSPSEEQGENEACGPLQVSAPVVAEENAEGEELPEVPAVMRSPRRYSHEHLHPTREYDPDSCNQPSDDNLSFKTALSTQPSYENLSNITQVSPVEHNSLLSSVSGCSTPNTSVLSHYGDANELLEQLIVGPHVRESYLVSTTGAASQIGSPEVSEARVPEECSLPEVVTTDSNILFTSGNTDDLRGPAPEKVVAPRVPLSGFFYFDRRSSISNLPVDTSHSLSSAKDILGYDPPGAGDLLEFTPPRERLACVSHSDKRPPPDADDLQEFAPVNVVASREHSPAILHYDRRSPTSSPSTESSYSSSSCQDVFGYAAAGGDAQESAPENVVAPQDRLSSVLHFDKASAKLGPSTESSHSPSSGKGVLVYAPLDADGNDSRSPEPSPTISHGYLVECAMAEACQSLVEDGPGSDEITESFDSECDDLTQRLSFPLPPHILPAEIVGHSTLSGEEDTSVLFEVAVPNIEKDMPNASTVLQHEEVQRILSGPDLTEKARQSQLPLVGSPDSDSDFTLRRSRAASDLTVKRRSSPVTTPGPTPCISRSSPPVEQPGRSDSVQSLYDQYFDNGTSDDGSEFSSPAHRDATLPDMSSSTEEPCQDVHLQSVDHTSHVFHRVSSPFFESKTSNSGTGSPWSETALRPLWTGQRSFLCSSLTKLVPKANPSDASSSPHPFPRLLDREIGSTIVPLGFRRYKPVVCEQF